MLDQAAETQPMEARYETFTYEALRRAMEGYVPKEWIRFGEKFAMKSDRIMTISVLRGCIPDREARGELVMKSESLLFRASDEETLVHLIQNRNTFLDTYKRTKFRKFKSSVIGMRWKTVLAFLRSYLAFLALRRQIQSLKRELQIDVHQALIRIIHYENAKPGFYSKASRPSCIEGTGRKLAIRSKRNWRQRYFIFSNKERAIRYYKTYYSGKAQGTFFLNSQTTVHLLEKCSGGTNVIRIQGGRLGKDAESESRSLFMYFPDQPEFTQLWLTYIQDSISEIKQSCKEQADEFECLSSDVILLMRALRQFPKVKELSNASKSTVSHLIYEELVDFIRNYEHEDENLDSMDRLRLEDKSTAAMDVDRFDAVSMVSDITQIYRPPPSSNSYGRPSLSLNLGDDFTIATDQASRIEGYSLI